MAENNLYSPMLAQVLRDMSANTPRLSVTNPQQQILSQTVEADKVRRQQQDMDTRQRQLQGVDPGMREWAPLAGVLKGIASNMQRTTDNERLDELYAGHTRAQQEEAEQAALAAQQEEIKAAAKAEDAHNRNRADMAADAQLEHERKVELRGVMSPEQEAALQQGRVMIANIQDQMTDRQEKRKANADSAATATENAATNTETSATATIDAIDSAIGRLDSRMATGFWGEKLKDTGGTDAYGLKGDLDTVTANLSFDALRDMREASKTGGALGSIAVRELDLLGAKVKNLRQGNKPEDLKENLSAVRGHYSNVISALRGEDPYSNDLEAEPDAEPQYAEGDTATNPQTGQVITFRGGKWVEG